MRFMIMVRADHNSEAGKMPSQDLLAKMGKFNEELVKAGVMLAGEGLHPTSRAARVTFSGGRATVARGPFPTNETVSGFWIWNVKSEDEALAWLKRAPFEDATLEVRKVFEAEDFGAEFTPELREREERLRAQVERQTKS